MPRSHTSSSSRRKARTSRKLVAVPSAAEHRAAGGKPGDSKPGDSKPGDGKPQR